MLKLKVRSRRARPSRRTIVLYRSAVRTAFSGFDGADLSSNHTFTACLDKADALKFVDQPALLAVHDATDYLSRPIRVALRVEE